MVSIWTSTDVGNMVSLVNHAFQCLVSFIVDLQIMYDQFYNLLRHQMDFLILEATFEKMNFGEDALAELQAITEQIDQLQGLSRQVIKDFSDTSK